MTNELINGLTRNLANHCCDLGLNFWVEFGLSGTGRTNLFTVYANGSPMKFSISNIVVVARDPSIYLVDAANLQFAKLEISAMSKIKVRVGPTDPADYNIAIRNDGGLFRIARAKTYDLTLPESDFIIVNPQSKSRGRREFFDVFGNLRKQFHALPRIH